MKKQIERFAFSPPTNLVEDGKWLLAVTSFEATNSVFIIIDKNNSFSITLPGHWNSKCIGKSFDEQIEFLELRSQNDIKFHVEQVLKNG